MPVDFHTTLLFIGFFIRIFAALLFGLIVLPAMWREARIAGSLRRVRRLLFILGIGYLCTMIGTMLLNVCRVYPCFNNYYFIEELAIVNSFGFLVTSIAWALIYRNA